MKETIKEGVIYTGIFGLSQLVLDYYYGREINLAEIFLSTIIATAVFAWVMPRARAFWEKS